MKILHTLINTNQITCLIKKKTQLPSKCNAKFKDDIQLYPVISKGTSTVSIDFYIENRR